GDQHHAALLVGNLVQDGRQHQLFDRPDLHRDDAKDESDRAALLKDVAAKTAEAGDAVGQVDFLRVLQLLPLAGGHDGGAHGDDVLVIEPFFFAGGDELPADAHHRITADLEMKIRRAVFDGDFQEIVDVHRSCVIGAWPPRL